MELPAICHSNGTPALHPLSFSHLMPRQTTTDHVPYPQQQQQHMFPQPSLEHYLRSANLQRAEQQPSEYAPMLTIPTASGHSATYPLHSATIQQAMPSIITTIPT